MKILYGITLSEWGGAQAHLFDLIKSQKNLGNDVCVFIGEDGELSKRLRDIGIKDVYILNNLKHHISPINDVKAVKEVRKLIKSFEPDIVHVHSSKAGVIGRIGAYKESVASIFTAHSWAFTEGVPKVKRLLYIMIERFLARKTSHIISVSKYDDELALKCKVLNNKIQHSVVYNGVEPIKRSLVNLPSKLNLVMVARFSEPKDHEGLIKELSKIDSSLYTLTLVGDGPNLDRTKELIKELGMQNIIRCVGFQSDVEKYLHEANCFILVSKREGFPISILEAMAVGIPVIASDVGGISEQIISNKTGFLLRSNDDIAPTVLKLTNDKKMLCEMGDSAFEYLKLNFTSDIANEKIDQIYKNIVTNN